VGHRTVGVHGVRSDHHEVTLADRLRSLGIRDDSSPKPGATKVPGERPSLSARETLQDNDLRWSSGGGEA
jgi:hypothetical protein